MHNRRSFVSSLLGAGVALPVLRAHAFRDLAAATGIGAGRGAADLASDEDYWGEIQRAFELDRTMINLNNGGCSPAPTHVLEQMIRDLRFSNELPGGSHVADPRAAASRACAASSRTEFGCDPEEMAITRNASEANETMIFGLDLKRGDEVIVTNQNYPRMLTTWDQRVRREGHRAQADLDSRCRRRRQQDLVDRFRAAITPRTKVIEVTHITNLTGQILPVREIVRVGAAAGHPGLRRRRARLRALPVQARRPRLRLLRHQAAQVAAGADRHRLPLRAEEPPDRSSGR